MVADTDAGIKPLQNREMVLLGSLIFFGVVLRLFAIGEPYVDGLSEGWSWRQADVAMIAENFYRHGFNIFYPQINWAGSQPGYVGTELPFVPFLGALLYLIFGVQDWIGRAISIVFFATSVPFLYFLVEKVWSTRAALFAVSIYIVAPLCIFAGRTFMPDMASLSFSLAALYFFSELLTPKKYNFKLAIAATVTLTLAILIKAPAAIIIMPVLYMAWGTYGFRSLFQLKLLSPVTIALVISLGWYLHAYNISLTYPPYRMFGEGALRIVEIDKYAWILQSIIRSLTPLICAAMATGIFLLSTNRFHQFFHWWLLAIVIFIIVAGRGNAMHPWYHLPLIPVASAFGGIALETGLRTLTKVCISKTASVFTCIIFFASLTYLSYTQIRPLYQPWTAWLETGKELNRLTPTRALVIVADHGDPTVLYCAKRRGWHFLGTGEFWQYPADNDHAIKELERLVNEGADYFAIPKYTFWGLEGKYLGFRRYLDSRYMLIRATDDYIIFDLLSKKA